MGAQAPIDHRAGRVVATASSEPKPRRQACRHPQGDRTATPWWFSCSPAVSQSHFSAVLPPPDKHPRLGRSLHPLAPTPPTRTPTAPGRVWRSSLSAMITRSPPSTLRTPLGLQLSAQNSGGYCGRCPTGRHPSGGGDRPSQPIASEGVEPTPGRDRRQGPARGRPGSADQPQGAVRR